VDSEDGPLISQTAHVLRSSSAAIHAKSLAAQLQRLEDAGKTGDIGLALQLIKGISSEFGRVVEFLKTIQKQHLL
jgi:hypothetical protein